MHFVIFELELMQQCSSNALKASAQNETDTNSTLDVEHEDNPNSTSTRILLKGQMRLMTDMDAIVFLCSPLLVYYKVYARKEKLYSNVVLYLGSTVSRNYMEWVYF